MGKKLTTKEFIERARKIHGNNYDYSQVSYLNSYTKLKIICKKHGSFMQLSTNHFAGNGCPICGSITSASSIKLDTKKFIKRANSAHNYKYDYSLVDYQGIFISVNIVCPIHGLFEQNASNHLEGSGCPSCAGVKRVNFSEIKERSRRIHGDGFLYFEESYKNTLTKMKVWCKKCQKYSWQMPMDHVHSRSGCPNCAITGFNLSNPAILYYIKIGSLYKIGITNRTIKERYSLKERNLFDDYKTWEMSGEEAYETEQSILKIYKDFKYIGESILESGNTELFTCDVLNCFSY